MTKEHIALWPHTYLTTEKNLISARKRARMHIFRTLCLAQESELAPPLFPPSSLAGAAAAPSPGFSASHSLIIFFTLFRSLLLFKAFRSRCKTSWSNYHCLGIEAEEGVFWLRQQPSTAMACLSCFFCFSKSSHVFAEFHGIFCVLEVIACRLKLRKMAFTYSLFVQWLVCLLVMTTHATRCPFTSINKYVTNRRLSPTIATFIYIIPSGSAFHIITIQQVDFARRPRFNTTSQSTIAIPPWHLPQILMRMLVKHIIGLRLLISILAN